MRLRYEKLRRLYIMAGPTTSFAEGDLTPGSEQASPISALRPKSTTRPKKSVLFVINSQIRLHGLVITCEEAGLISSSCTDPGAPERRRRVY